MRAAQRFYQSRLRGNADHEAGTQCDDLFDIDAARIGNAGQRRGSRIVGKGGDGDELPPGAERVNVVGK